MTDTNTVPLACDPTAIPAAERAEHGRLAARLFDGRTPTAAVDAATEGAGEGYAFAFRRDDFPALSRWVERERLCCPFLRFELEVMPEGGPVGLVLTGPEGTRAFLEAELPLRASGGGRS